MLNGNKMEKEPITNLGLEKLKEELIFLKEKKRPEIVAAIAEARSHGDLKENAEYHAAKEQQSHSEGRIQAINDIIARANVIDVTKITNDGKIIFGSTVYLENLDNGEKLQYKIVGKDEADVKNKLIYFKSPIGKGLINKKIGCAVRKDINCILCVGETGDQRKTGKTFEIIEKQVSKGLAGLKGQDFQNISIVI